MCIVFLGPMLHISVMPFSQNYVSINQLRRKKRNIAFYTIPFSDKLQCEIYT